MEVAQNVDVRRQAQTRLPPLVELLVLAEPKVESYESVDASRRGKNGPQQTAVAIAHAMRRRRSKRTASQQLRVTTLERGGEKRKASPSAAELDRVARVQLRCSS